MENKVAIVVDSGMDLPKEYQKENVFILPLKVIRDGEALRDGVDIEANEVARTIDYHDYKTSLPSPGEIEELFQSIKEQGFTKILAITISSGLSGTNQAVHLVASDFEGLDIEIIDTLSIGIGAGLHAVHAIELLEENKPMKEIATVLRNNVKNSKVYFCVATLEYLAKGGRIGKVASVLGHAFNLKPIITCNEEGIYDTVAKVRGRRQSINQAIKHAEEFAKNKGTIHLAIAHCLVEEEMMYVKEQLVNKCSNISKIFTGDISPALTIHTGPGLLAITIYEK